MMENNISIRIYMKNGKVEAVVPQWGWYGQVDVEVVTALPKACKDKTCHEDGPHRHETISTAVISAESRE